MILIIDFGSQFNQLIARRVREHEVFCQIEPPGVSLEKIKALAPKGIILSGGPSSIYDENSPKIDEGIFDLSIPILGICYGFHFLTHVLGGKVKGADKREYGFASLSITDTDDIFEEISPFETCWMSHGDSIESLPSGFKTSASTENTPFAAASNKARHIYGVQFHPEVEHTPFGKKMLKNFLFNICHAEKKWTMASFAKESIASIKERVGDNQVILGLSGGVDSSVTALIIHKAIGKNLTCIFVDNGLLRKNEGEQLKERLSLSFDINIRFIDAKDRFLNALKGVTDPEEKRKIIGRVFMEVFEDEAQKIENADFLGQGTLYPDVIESQSVFGGPSSMIKSHHNVGGLPEKMKLKLVEPLKFLFKDEVRALGAELGLAEDMIHRQPFPGPGLAIRIIGEITEERLSILRETDAIVLEEIRASGYYKKLWQSFAVLLPVKSVGIMGDGRTYEHIAAIRAVNSIDAMTADWARLPHDLLAKISSRIINEVRGVNRVVYDISSKPPSTIEWE